MSEICHADGDLYELVFRAILHNHNGHAAYASYLLPAYWNDEQRPVYEAALQAHGILASQRISHQWSIHYDQQQIDLSQNESHFDQLYD